MSRAYSKCARQIRPILVHLGFALPVLAQPLCALSPALLHVTGSIASATPAAHRVPPGGGFS